MSFGIVLFDVFIPAIIAVPVTGVFVFMLFVGAVLLDERMEK